MEQKYSADRRKKRGGGGRTATRDPKNYFFKLVKDENAKFRKLDDVRRFMESMSSFPLKSQLLAHLEDDRNHGPLRIQEALGFVGSPNDVEAIFIPLLKNLVNQETDRPLNKKLRNRLLATVFTVPRLMESLCEMDAATVLSKESADSLSMFLTKCCHCLVEAMHSEHVKTMAKSLRSRGDVESAARLCAILAVDETPADNRALLQERSEEEEGICWVPDFVPPGNRHDNDFVNFRNIKLIPTLNEIKCKMPSYLPAASGENNFIHDRSQRLLDSNFRLLREDALETIRINLKEQRRKWLCARVIGVNCAGKHKKSLAPISFVVQCDSRPGGDPDWKRGKALRFNCVVALCRNTEPIRLATISHREDQIQDEWLNAYGGPKVGLTFYNRQDFDASLDEVARNASLNDSLLKTMKEWNHQPQEQGARMDDLKAEMITYTLVEISDSFFSYQPILSCLQSTVEVPFSEELVYNTRPPNDVVGLGYLPRELRLPECPVFQEERLNLDAWSSENLTQHSTLDKSQADALHHALTSRVSLIQGPPGTGKTFIGGLISRIIRENSDCSILCVCYTNHALDQFLEHMVEAGERAIVRIGGHSKSDKLTKFQLRELSRQGGRSSVEPASGRLKQLTAQLHGLREEIEQEMQKIQAPMEWDDVRAFLEESDPETLSFLSFTQLDDGFQLVGADNSNLKSDFLWEKYINEENFPSYVAPYMWVDDEREFQRFWMPRNRHRNINRIREEFIEDLREPLFDLARRFEDLLSEKELVTRSSDISILKQARVIGATTTGCAQYKEILNEKQPEVVIIEEAGEVLEAHVLTSLCENTEHLILIGDHKQLRPKVDTYELSTVSRRGYNLDCSLFERLIKAGQPSVSLKVQHRMIPAISDLIRMQTYPELIDHESVLKRPEIRGVSHNLVFIDHEYPEDGAIDNAHETNRTKSNEYECMFCIELVRYFLLQGYRHDQIVVLTPYLGQLMKIMRAIKNKLKEVSAYISEFDQKEIDDLDMEDDGHHQGNANRVVRCSTVDNFQGEEADIVIISLVRANPIGSIGFLKEPQRVNVLLSRARCGMFLVGNTKTLRASKKGREVWIPLLNRFQQDGQLQKGLPSTCEQHPDDVPIVLKNAMDFRRYRPNGGCDRPCNFRLACGHACPKTCHFVDRNHTIGQRECNQPCRRVPEGCPKLHPCPKRCREECGPCQQTVESTTLLCSHIEPYPRCYEVGDRSGIEAMTKKCRQSVRFSFGRCGHIADTFCFNARSDDPVCPSKCGSTLPCFHECQNQCGKCDNKHDCKQRCTRPLFCNHECKMPCHEAGSPGKCPPCKKPCGLKCEHSKCGLKCYEPCPSCVEPCFWECEHRGKCSLVCSAPCSRLPCDERCTKRLRCGHQCPGLCGEPCPTSKYCQICCSKERKNEVIDVISLTTYHDHDLYEDPIIVLPCGHFFATSALDGHLGLSLVYALDRDGSFVQTKPLAGSGVEEKLKGCITCRAPIHSIKRYGRVLKLTELKNLERKHLMTLDNSLRAFSHLEDPKEAIKRLNELKKSIMDSPIRKVLHACGGKADLEIPHPPVLPMIRTHQMMGAAYRKLIKENGDKLFENSRRCFKQGIELTVASRSYNSGAKLRLELCSLLLERAKDMESTKTEVYSHVDWILNHDVISDTVQQEARRMKDRLLNTDDLVDVIKAMQKINGYDYGGSWASHWKECPNGHPYFIGECGRAMQESRCPECGAAVGGRGHTLLSTNRSRSSMVEEIMRSAS